MWKWTTEDMRLVLYSIIFDIFDDKEKKRFIVIIATFISANKIKGIFHLSFPNS